MRPSYRNVTDLGKFWPSARKNARKPPSAYLPDCPSAKAPVRLRASPPHGDLPHSLHREQETPKVCPMRADRLFLSLHVVLIASESFVSFLPRVSFLGKRARSIPHPFRLPPRQVSPPPVRHHEAYQAEHQFQTAPGHRQACQGLSWRPRARVQVSSAPLLYLPPALPPSCLIMLCSSSRLGPPPRESSSSMLLASTSTAGSKALGPPDPLRRSSSTSARLPRPTFRSRSSALSVMPNSM
jgi:hypothetical protein